MKKGKGKKKLDAKSKAMLRLAKRINKSLEQFSGSTEVGSFARMYWMKE